MPSIQDIQKWAAVASFLAQHKDEVQRILAIAPELMKVVPDVMALVEAAQAEGVLTTLSVAKPPFGNLVR